MTGIYAFTGTVAILESTLWGTDDWANETDWLGTNNIITGSHNHWAAPAFINPVAGDYHIAFDSAAIDTGISTGFSTDIDGNSRPTGLGYDIGADEWTGYYLYLPLMLKKS